MLMKTRNRVVHRYLRPTGEHKIGVYHVDIPVKSVIKLGGKGSCKKLKAGETYKISFASGLEANSEFKGAVMFAQVNPQFGTYGFVSVPTRTITPLDQGVTDLTVLFDCKKDMDLEKIDTSYGVRIIVDENIYSRWA